MEWIIFFIVIAIIVVIKSIKVVNSAEVYIIERFGKYNRTAKAGVNCVIPFIDKIKAKINLKVQVERMPCKIITKDYKECLVTYSAFSQIINPQNFYYNNSKSEEDDMIKRLKSCTSYRISVCIRDVMGKMNLEELRTTEKLKLKKMIDENICIDKDGFEIDNDKCGYKIFDIQIEDICYTK